MNIAIIGSGVFGIGNAISLASNKDNKVIVWTESDESLKKIEDSRDNYEALNGIKIPKSIKFTTSYEEALKDANLVLLMTSAKFIDSVTKAMKPYINDKMVFVIGSKGIEQNTCRFLHEVFKDNIRTRNLGILSGPSFAIDIAHNEPVALACATNNINVCNKVKRAYKGTNIKIRRSKDLVGTELAGSIKNVIAIAAGILEGLGYKESTRAFLITESLHDIKELTYKLGGNKKSILSYAGVGDLLLTATSTKSRNYSYGILLANNKKKSDEFLNNNTVEGYYTLKSIYSLIKKKKVKMPLIDLIYKIVVNGDDPNLLIDFLLKKD
jgi:glycerol-3-phosphate dehydrogenase (NAD(P)+)